MLCTLRQIFQQNFQILSRSHSKFFNLVDLILTLTGVLDEFEKINIDIKFIETDCSRHWAIQQWSDGTEDTGVDLGETFTWVEWWSGFVAGWFVGLDLFTLVHGLTNFFIFFFTLKNYLEELNPALSWLDVSIWSFKTGDSSHGTFHDWTIVIDNMLHAWLNVVWCSKGDSGDEKWKFHFWKYNFD